MKYDTDINYTLTLKKKCETFKILVNWWKLESDNQVYYYRIILDWLNQQTPYIRPMLF